MRRAYLREQREIERKRVSSCMGVCSSEREGDREKEEYVCVREKREGMCLCVKYVCV